VHRRPGVFDVYLKAHSGDPLRVGRVSREGDTVDEPALSVALSVQPDVVRGLADQGSMREQGFLARWWYSLPRSIVGSRAVRTAPVSDQIRQEYRTKMQALWRLRGGEVNGKVVPHILKFCDVADGPMAALERWLEPQLGEWGELSHMAGWANKLAGAIARLSGSLHMANAAGGLWECEISAHTVSTAVQIGRDYLLPHALAAFNLMGANEVVESARHVWGSICRRCEYREDSENTPPSIISLRSLHQWNRRRFPSADQLLPVVDVLVKEKYLRPVPGSGEPGKGHKSPEYLVNPRGLALYGDKAPRTHCTHRAQPDREPGEEGE
jgi:replicative DNA helicase